MNNENNGVSGMAEVVQEDNTQQQQNQSAFDQVSQLEERTGVKLNELGGNNEEHEQGRETGATETGAETGAETTEGQDNNELEAFTKQFERYFGSSPQAAIEAVESVSRQVAELKVELAQKELQVEWGSSYDSNLEEVRNYWGNLPEEQKAALDNIDGARLIHAKLQQDKTNARSNYPGFQRTQSNVAAPQGNTNGGVFLMSEYMKLSSAEKDRVLPQLLAAKQSGRLVNDVV